MSYIYQVVLFACHCSSLFLSYNISNLIIKVYLSSIYLDFDLLYYITITVCLMFDPDHNLRFLLFLIQAINFIAISVTITIILVLRQELNALS